MTIAEIKSAIDEMAPEEKLTVEVYARASTLVDSRFPPKPSGNFTICCPSKKCGLTPALIRAENVGKKFCRNLKKSLIYGVQDVSYDLLGKNRK